MRSAILGKLQPYLNEYPKSEADVVYVLVEIRKLMDQADEKKNYPDLAFFCDWAVHPKLEYNKTARAILQTLEENVIDINFLDIDNTFDPGRKAGQIFSFDRLKDEFSQFCNDNGLPTSWADGDCWSHFMALYAKVIQDCPLELKQPDPSKKLQRAVLTAVDEPDHYIEEPHSGKVMLRLNWELTTRDGRVAPFGFNLVLTDQ